jgi:hypothetical protein
MVNLYNFISMSRYDLNPMCENELPLLTGTKTIFHSFVRILIKIIKLNYYFLLVYLLE